MNFGIIEHILTNIVGEENIKFDTLLSSYTSIKIGGKASIIITPTSISQIEQVVNICKRYKVKLFCLGAGTNTIFKDNGFNGVVMILSRNFSHIKKSKNTLIALAGTSLTVLNKYAMSKGLSGIENTFLIPGSVGGATTMNAGAYGFSIGEKITMVTALINGEIVNFTNKKCKFGYRDSIFSHTEDCIILSVNFSLSPCNQNLIKNTFMSILKKRLATQPINEKSAGSVFLRGEDYIPAKMIDDLGLKGKTIGGAMISNKHAGFIINYKNATCKDVTNLIDFICQKVYNKYTIKLKTEIIIVGEK